MATIVKRKDGRFELRESRWTERGPRSRTLAIFRELTPEVLNRADARATKPVDRDSLLARAEELGLHMSRLLGPSEPSAVVGRINSGEVWPTQIRALQQSLDDVEAPHLREHLEAMVQWMGTSDEVRGRTLVDLLRLAQAIMRHRDRSRREPLSFPSLAKCP